MTRRKPEGLPWDSWVERQIREAHDQGAFDDLPGRGRPLPGLDAPHDELWWVKQKLAREEVAVVPPSLRLRRDVERARERISRSRSEEEVRATLARLDARIRRHNAHATAGPPSDVAPLDVEAEVDRWRRARGGA